MKESKTDSMSLILLTSPSWKEAETPLLEIIYNNFREKLSFKISFTPIWAPSLAKVIAIPLPIPFRAPVINTFLPLSNPTWFS